MRYGITTLTNREVKSLISSGGMGDTKKTDVVEIEGWLPERGKSAQFALTVNADDCGLQISWRDIPRGVKARLIAGAS